MHFCIKCIFASNAFLHSQNAFCRFLTFCKQNVRAASNAFLYQMHFCIKCICNILLMLNILLRKMYAEHFPLENVRVAEHFPLENVRQNAFWHQMHFCIKCIFASNAFLQNKMYASNAFLHQMHFCTAKMHFCIKCIFASNTFLQSQMYATQPWKTGFLYIL